jgi:hypothetical protein
MPIRGRSVDDVRAGALERDGPRRGGVVPSSETVLVEGALSPRARRTSPEGAVEPSSEADLARGGVKVSSEADLARGSVEASNEVDSTCGGIRCATLAAAGATRVVIVSRVCFRFMG